MVAGFYIFDYMVAGFYIFDNMVAGFYIFDNMVAGFYICDNMVQFAARNPGTYLLKLKRYRICILQSVLMFRPASYIRIIVNSKSFLPFIKAFVHSQVCFWPVTYFRYHIFFVKI